MYDDLARTQNLPPLEWFVVHAVIPSLIVTLVLQVGVTRGAQPATHAPNYTIIPDVLVRDAGGCLLVPRRRPVPATAHRLVPPARQTIIDHLRVITEWWQPLPMKVRVPVEFTVKE